MASIKAASRGIHLLAARAVHSAKDGEHSDGGGLLLRVKGLNASWVYRFTSPVTGKRREMGLGPVVRNDLAAAGASVKRARELAATARLEVQAGADPIDSRDQEREAIRLAAADRKAAESMQSLTLARFARSYFDKYIEGKRSDKHAGQWIASLEHHVGAIWHRPLGDITGADVLAALVAIRPHERARRNTSDDLGETKRRVFQRLHVIFARACAEKLCRENPAAAIKPLLKEDMPKPKVEHQRALPYAEVREFLAAVRQQPGTAAVALEFLLLTAARTSEVLEAHCSEFDLVAGVWTVPAGRMKAGEAHVVPLSPRALELARLQIGQAGGEGPLFSSPRLDGEGKRRALSNMALLTLLDRMRWRDRTTVHGLRATFSTWAYDKNQARPDVIEVVLAHREGDRVAKAYNRAQFLAERQALLVAWTAFCEPVCNVVMLKTA